MKAGERTHHLRLLNKLLDISRRARQIDTMHALDKLQYALDQGVEAPSTRFITAVAARGLVRVQMAPFLAAGGRIGVVEVHLAAQLTRWPLTRVPLVLTRSRTTKNPSVLTSTLCRFESPACSIRTSRSGSAPRWIVLMLMTSASFLASGHQR